MNPTKLPEVMVATASRRGLTDVLQAMTSGIAGCENVVLARIWLLGPDSSCPICRAREEAGSADPALHLAASGGASRNPPSEHTRIDGAFHRFPLGERKIGRVAETGEPLLLAGLRGDEAWVVDPGWLAREGIRTLAAHPLAYRGTILGVLAVFDRGVLDEYALEWLRVFADYAAVSIANARAFEEIERLRARLEEENLYLREEVSAALGMGEFIGESPGLQKVFRQIQLVAPTDAAVLITGESGTGKELVARAIHEQSSRRERPLIRVNCGAIPEGLFESEFFGHVRGAFTGALRDRVGRFELADQGTLFLDEIGEVPLALQAKLLRVLQEREFERVGDTRTRATNVRIIAATNRDLNREVEAGRFRQDLYYRLSVFPVDIPPLRERAEDIAPLVRHFVQQAAKRLARPAPTLTAAVLRRLTAHRWPGNVRELQNVIERAVILTPGGPLRVDQILPAAVEGSPPSGETPAPPRLLTRDELRRMERENIVRALDQSGGKVFGTAGAAVLLGLKPTTLLSRIAALGITRTRGART